MDGVLERDGVRYVLQCKRYNTATVNEPQVRELLGAMSAYARQHGPVQGICITTGRFTSDAVRFAKQNEILLCDGNDFLTLLQRAFPPTDNDDPFEIICPECGQPAPFPLQALTQEGATSACPRGHIVTNTLTQNEILQRRICGECGAPMVRRKRTRDGSPF